MSPGEAAAALAALPIEDTLGAVLAAQAKQIAATVRAGFTTPLGGPHDLPWRQSGALAASIAVTAEGLVAAIGSNDPAAVAQELGTLHDPPRPFLAPAGHLAAEATARLVGQALAELLTRRLT